MSVKSDVVKDVLCVIAHGTPNARSSAANLLFHYWPSLNPTLYDRRGIHIKFSGKYLELWLNSDFYNLFNFTLGIECLFFTFH